MSQPQAFAVSGMSCGHCVAAVEREVGAVAGVARVDVALDSGRLVVAGEGVDPAAVVAAVEEAGYRAVVA